MRTNDIAKGNKEIWKLSSRAYSKIYNLEMQKFQNGYWKVTTGEARRKKK